jgi:hypothetical protein
MVHSIVLLCGHLHTVVLFHALFQVFSTIGVASTVYWLYDLRNKWRERTARRQEEARKLQLLRNTDHFIVHLIHIGGEGTSFNTLRVRGEEEGGYFFNPPQEFVRVSSNRPGDLSLICASELSRSEGYVVDSVAGPDGKFRKRDSPDMAYLLHKSMKDQISVKFVKTAVRPRLGRVTKKRFWKRWGQAFGRKLDWLFAHYGDHDGVMSLFPTR